MQKTPCAFPSLALISPPAPPVVVTVAARYSNFSTSSSTFLLDLYSRINIPFHYHCFSTFVCMSNILLATRATSSANSKSSSLFANCHLIPVRLPSIVLVISAVCVLSYPQPDQWHSLMPKISTLYLYISLTTYAIFPMLYIVLTFQFPIRSIFLGLANGLIRVQASFRFVYALLIPPSSHLMNSYSEVCQVIVLLPR